MADLYQFYGADLQVDAHGDLLLASDTVLGQQSVLRRLLTNPLDDAWNPNYGAGLPRFVGQPSAPLQIAGVIRSQLQLEAVVAAQPAPGVSVIGQADGTVIASITYTDAASGGTQLLTVPLGG